MWLAALTVLFFYVSAFPRWRLLLWPPWAWGGWGTPALDCTVSSLLWASSILRNVFPDTSCLPSCGAGPECLSCTDSRDKALMTLKRGMGGNWARLSYPVWETWQHEQEKEQRLVCMREPLAACHRCLLVGGGGEGVQIFKTWKKLAE